MNQESFKLIITKPCNKKPSKKQEPPQQQEFIIPYEIKIKKRK